MCFSSGATLDRNMRQNSSKMRVCRIVNKELCISLYMHNFSMFLGDFLSIGNKNQVKEIGLSNHRNKNKFKIITLLHNLTTSQFIELIRTATVISLFKNRKKQKSKSRSTGTDLTIKKYFNFCFGFKLTKLEISIL
jgi:hypothetical protein